MKITICAYDAPNNIDGPTTWLKGLVPTLYKNDISVSILFYANKYKKSKLATYNYFKNQGFKCKIIHHGMYADEVGYEILKDIQRDKPDIVILNYLPFALMLSRWLNDWKIPSIMVMHNADEHHINMAKAYAKNEDKRLNVSMVVAISKSLEKKLMSLGIFDNLKYIPIGVEIIKTNGERKNEPFNILYAGRLNKKEKRITDVVKAFCLASKEIEGTNYTICGIGEDEIIVEIENIIRNEGQADRVKYIGALSNTELRKIMLHHHCIVLMSESEGLGIVILEGMAQGLVPILYNMKSGIAEEITSGHNGLIINDRTNEFVKAVNALKQEPLLFSKLSSNSISLVKEEYSLDKTSESWVSLLHAIKLNTTPECQSIPKHSELRDLVNSNRSLYKHYNIRPKFWAYAYLKKVYQKIKLSVM